MLILQSSFYAIAIGLCLLCGFFALHSRSNVPVRYFLVYLSLEAFSFTCEWLMIHPGTPYKGLWLSGIMSVSFFIAPCLWLYAHELNDRTSPSIRELPSGHWQIIVVGQILLLPLLSSIHSGTIFPNLTDPVSAQYSQLIHTTMLVAVIVFLAQTVFYLSRCIQILNQRAAQNKGLFAHLADPALNTLRVLIIAVFTNWLISAMRTLYCLTIGAEIGVGVVFSGVELAIIVFIIFSTFKQETEHQENDQAVREALYFDGQTRASIRTVTHQAKYARSKLSKDQRAAILAKLEQSMTRERLYQESDLSLRRLCEHIDETPHLVSQVINESEHTSFYDMINRHRIDDAKLRLQSQPTNSVLNIAFDVGYNSKSTFNTAFRKFTHMTPTQFRSQASTDATTSA